MLVDGRFLVTFFGRWIGAVHIHISHVQLPYTVVRCRVVGTFMWEFTHMWRRNSRVGVIHVWEGQSHVGVTHLWKGHSHV